MIGDTPGEYKEFLFEPNVSLYPNGSLMFTRIGKESESHYLCEARNTIGSGVSKLIFLKVNGTCLNNLLITIIIAIRKAPPWHLGI